MLRLDGGLGYEQQSKGAGQGGHTVHEVDGDGKARLSPIDEGKEAKRDDGRKLRRKWEKQKGQKKLQKIGV